MILWAPRTTPDPGKLKIYLDALGYVSRETLPVPELAFLGHRSIIVLKKQRASRKGYPRKWKEIKDSISEWNKVQSTEK